MQRNKTVIEPRIVARCIFEVDYQHYCVYPHICGSQRNDLPPPHVYRLESGSGRDSRPLTNSLLCRDTPRQAQDFPSPTRRIYESLGAAWWPRVPNQDTR